MANAGGWALRSLGRRARHVGRHEGRLSVARRTSVSVGVLRARALGRTLARVLVVVGRVRLVVTTVRVELVRRHARVHGCRTEVLGVARVLHLRHVGLRWVLRRAVPATVVVRRALRSL